MILLHMRADKVWIESEEKYRLICESTGLGSGYWTQEGRAISFNAYAQKEMPTTAYGVPGKSAFELYGDSIGAIIKTRITEIFKFNKKFSYQDFVKFADLKRYFFSTYNPIHDNCGRIHGVQIISKDISELKRIEEIIQVSKERYRLLSDALLGDIQNHKQNEIPEINQPPDKKLGHESLGEITSNQLISKHLTPNNLITVIEKLKEDFDGSNKIAIINKGGKKLPVEILSGDFNHYGEQFSVTLVRDITADKQGQVVLYEKDVMYRALFEHSPVAIAVVRGGNFFCVNQACAEMFRFDGPDEMHGSSIYERIPHEYADWVKKNDLRFEKSIKTSKSFETTARKKDGSEFPVQMFIEVIRFDDGIATSIFAFDLTERKQYEKASEKNGRSTIKDSPFYIFSLNPEGTIQSVNRNFMGISKDLLPGRRIYELVPPKLVPTVKKCLGNVVKSGLIGGYEAEHQMADGSTITYEARVCPEINQGEVTALTVKCTDVTEFRKTKKWPGTSEDFYRTTFEQAAIGIGHASFEGKLILTNRRLCKMFGYEAEMLITLSLKDLLHPDDLKENKRLSELSLRGKIDYYSLEIRYFPKNKSLRWAYLRVSLRRDDNGEPLYFICVFEDCTKSKETELALQQSHAKLQEQVKESTVELKEANTAFKVILKHNEAEKAELTDNLVTHVKSLITPNLKRLKRGQLGQRETALVNSMETSLDEILSPFVNTMISKTVGLTPRELEIAKLIRDGYSNDEISEMLIVSKSVVAFHRMNIRDKLGIKNKKINLRSYLQDLSV